MIGRPAVGEVAPGVFRFRRPVMRILLDLLLAPVGAVGFLVMAWFMATGALGQDPITRIAAVMPAFFGMLLTIGALITVRRGVRRTVFEVTPDGIWSPESGRLPWYAIAEVRMESMRGLNDADVVATTDYLRVGVVPKDASLAARQRSWRAATALGNAFLGFVQRIVPGTRLGPVDLAAFGVAGYEIEESIADVVNAVRRYAPIVDADERRARERAPMWAARARQGPATPPITSAEIRAIDARLAPGAPVPAAPRADAIPHGPPPRVTFLRPGLGLSVVGSAIMPGAFIVLGIFAGGQMLSTFLTGAPIWIAALYITVPGVFVAAGLLMLRSIISRARRSLGPRETLAVGPDGIWTPGKATPLPWADVAWIRTERAGFTRVGPGQVEAWRIVVQPVVALVGGEPVVVHGGPVSVRSDDLDAPFDDVLDLIRYYHPVIETG